MKAASSSVSRISILLVLRFIVSGLSGCPRFPDTLSQSETAMKSLRRAAVGKSPLVARSGALYGKRYNLLSKSCNAVRCPPGSFYTPKLPRTIASRRNAQHNFSRKPCIQAYLPTGILRLTDTSIITDRDNLKPETPDNLIIITEGVVVRESNYLMTFGISVDTYSDVRRLRISGAMVGIPECPCTLDISDTEIFSQCN